MALQGLHRVLLGRLVAGPTKPGCQELEPPAAARSGDVGAVASPAPEPQAGEVHQSRSKPCPAKATETPQTIIHAEGHVIQAELGRGNFGKVFLVQHKETCKSYAMKVLEKREYSRKNWMPYALMEKQVHANLRHPCIVGLHHAFQTKTRLVMLLQYCPGGDLEALLARRRSLPESSSRFYVAEVLLALLHLHRHRLVHRDVKPANVLLDEGGHALLTDFGLTKEEVDGQPNGFFDEAGTTQYLAPEILNRTGYGRLVDIYNLGTLAFELMSGCVPFYHSERTQFCLNVKTAELVCPPFFSESAVSFVLGTMARDLERRAGAAGTGELLGHAWFAGLSFDGLLARQVQPPQLPEQHDAEVSGSQPGSEPQSLRPFSGDDPFAQDRIPYISEMPIEDWDHFGSGSLSLPEQQTAELAAQLADAVQSNEGTKRNSSRASCLFASFRCFTDGSRRRQH